MPTSYMAVRRTRGRAWDASLPMRAQAQWAEHAVFMNALAAEGVVVLGGPLGSGEDVLLIVNAVDEATVRARLAADPWSASGLLDIRTVEPWTILLDAGLAQVRSPASGAPMTDRRVDGFFYGLYMDVDVLREAGVAPSNPRRAHVDGFALRIGRRATLLPSAGARAWGMLYALTHAELERLYTAPGLELYRPEAILAVPVGGTPTPALCYNLRQAPRPDERNPDYAERLRRALTKLDFPPEYIASVV